MNNGRGGGPPYYQQPHQASQNGYQPVNQPYNQPGMCQQPNYGGQQPTAYAQQQQQLENGYHQQPIARSFPSRMTDNRGALPPQGQQMQQAYNNYPPLPQHQQQQYQQPQQQARMQPHQPQSRPMQPQPQQQQTRPMQQQPPPQQMQQQQPTNSARDNNYISPSKKSAFVMDFPQWRKPGDTHSSELIARTHLLLTGDDSRKLVAFCKYNPLHVLDHDEIEEHEADCVDKRICEALLNL